MPRVSEVKRFPHRKEPKEQKIQKKKGISGGTGKKGKVFLSNDQISNLLTDIVDKQEQKLGQKIEKMGIKKQRELEQKKKQQQRKREKRMELNQVKKELKERKPKEKAAPVPEPTKKKVRFA